jgi:hypothetical protein
VCAGVVVEKAEVDTVELESAEAVLSALNVTSDEIDDVTVASDETVV